MWIGRKAALYMNQLIAQRASDLPWSARTNGKAAVFA